MPVLAVARAVRRLRQDDELAVAVRQLHIEVEQVLVGRVAVPNAAQHQHGAMHLLRIDLRQVDGHVEVGAGRDGVPERSFRRDDRLRHGRIDRAGMAVAGEDRADHGGVALAPRVGAQLVGARGTPRDLRRAGALVGEGAKDKPVDALGMRVCVSAGADRARRRAVEMHLLHAGFLQHDWNGGLEIFDAAVDVGVVSGAFRAAVAVVVHGPDVESVAGHHVHEGILALTRHAEVVGRACRVRRAMNHEQHRPRLFAGLRRAHALAPEVELGGALLRPVFRAPDAVRCRDCELRLRRCHTCSSPS